MSAAPRRGAATGGLAAAVGASVRAAKGAPRSPREGPGERTGDWREDSALSRDHAAPQSVFSLSWPPPTPGVAVGGAVGRGDARPA